MGGKRVSEATHSKKASELTSTKKESDGQAARQMDEAS
jgi:hypothetical protein